MFEQSHEVWEVNENLEGDELVERGSYYLLKLIDIV